MKTKSFSALDCQRSWYIVDAEDAVLGRLASRVASVLRGKNKPTFTPGADTGDFIVIVNAEKVRVTGNKEQAKQYWHYTGYQSGARSITVEKQRAEHPERIIAHAVKGMLPKGPLGRQMFKKLKVYAGPEHPHKAQKPEPLTF
jgi:large subunit ribosomal protein L13